MDAFHRILTSQRQRFARLASDAGALAARRPRAARVALVGFGLALGFGLPAELAVGLMLLAASPGGATANIYSHLARGDVALNITLTAINSLLCLLTLPLILNLALEFSSAPASMCRRRCARSSRSR